MRPAGFLAALAITFASLPCFADQIVVNKSSLDGYTTVQAGIDAAAPGDTVKINPGLYVENPQIMGKAIELWGVDSDSVTLTNPTDSLELYKIVVEPPVGGPYALEVIGDQSSVYVADGYGIRRLTTISSTVRGVVFRGHNQTVSHAVRRLGSNSVFRNCVMRDAKYIGCFNQETGGAIYDSQIIFNRDYGVTFDEECTTIVDGCIIANNGNAAALRNPTADGVQPNGTTPNVGDLFVHAGASVSVHDTWLTSEGLVDSLVGPQYMSMTISGPQDFDAHGVTKWPAVDQTRIDSTIAAGGNPNLLNLVYAYDNKDAQDGRGYIVIDPDQTVTSIADNAIGELLDFRNYPNPFNPATNLWFSLPEAGLVTINVYDVAGRKVDSVVKREHFDAGSHRIYWEPANLASGTYTYSLSVNGKRLGTGKLTLLK